MKTVRRAILLLGLASGCLPAAGDGDPAARLRMTVTPTAIQMGMFYTGADMRVEGVIGTGAKVAVVVRGALEREVFNRKVKAGPIWINSGKVAISGVPSLFLRFTDGRLRDSLAREEIDRYQIDQAAIQRRMEVDPDVDHELMVASWLNLKAQDGKYALVRDGVKMGPPAGDVVLFKVEFPWPKRALPGEYSVSAYEYRDGKVIASVEVPLRVERVGFAAWMAGIVKERSLLYGVMAVVVAAITGFGIDFLVALIFGKKAATAH